MVHKCLIMILYYDNQLVHSMACPALVLKMLCAIDACFMYLVGQTHIPIQLDQGDTLMIVVPFE